MLREGRCDALLGLWIACFLIPYTTEPRHVSVSTNVPELALESSMTAPIAEMRMLARVRVHIALVGELCTCFHNCINSSNNTSRCEHHSYTISRSKAARPHRNRRCVHTRAFVRSSPRWCAHRLLSECSFADQGEHRLHDQRECGCGAFVSPLCRCAASFELTRRTR